MLALMKFFCGFSGERPTERSDGSGSPPQAAQPHIHDACPLAAALWAAPRPRLPNIPYTARPPWGPFSLLGSLPEHDSFWEDFRSAPSHGIYIFPSWKTQTFALLFVVLPIAANTFPFLYSAWASDSPLDEWVRIMHRSSCSPNFQGALRAPSLGLRWRKATPFLPSAESVSGQCIAHWVFSPKKSPLTWPLGHHHLYALKVSFLASCSSAVETQSIKLLSKWDSEVSF